MTSGGARADAGSPGRPVAAIDCGTNSTRLLIADGEGREVLRLVRITRLGQGVDATRLLDAEAVERTMAVLADYRRLMDEHGVGTARMAATSAVRDAGNGDTFLDGAAEILGVRPELLSGDAEGRLSYAGASVGLGPVAGADVVVDIGGGSTELVVGWAGAVSAVSLDIGCVRLTERCLRHDPPLRAELVFADEVIVAALERALLALPVLGALPPESRLIGLAGTVSTLSVLDQGLPAYDRDRVHHSVLSIAAVERWCRTLAAEPDATRARRPGMVSGREDVIVGGALVLRAVMRRFGFDECVVSESDILDGLVRSLST